MIEELNFISHNRWQAKHYNSIHWEWDDPTVSKQAQTINHKVIEVMISVRSSIKVMVPLQAR